MRKIKIISVTAALAFGMLAGWRVGVDEVANIELQEDMHDLASESRNYVRYVPPRSDDGFRDAVISKAREHNITLEPSQVTVERAGSGADVYLAADYKVPVNLPWYSFVLHFTPSSTKTTF